MALVVVLGALTVPLLHLDGATSATAKADLSISAVEVLNESAPAGCCDPVVGGQTFDYKLTVFNNGPQTASGVTLWDQLRPDMTFVDPPSGCTAGPTIRCAGGNLPAHTSWTVLIPVTVTGISGSDSIVDNLVYVKSQTHDPLPFNNTDDEWTTVKPGADLALSMSGALGPASGQISYTGHITNDGPNKTTGVVVTFTIPAGTTWNRIPAGCTADTAIVRCTIGTMTSGLSVDKTFIVAVGPGNTGAMTSTGTVTSTSPPDPELSNNTASATVTV